MTDIKIKDLLEFGKSIGGIQTLTHMSAYSDLLKYATIFQVRENEEYKKIGITWEQYCTDIIGEPKRTVNDKLKDIKPLVDNFRGSLARISKLPFNKIRYLGRTMGQNLPTIENNTLIIDNTPIPITSDNKEEIEAAIDTLIDTHKQEKKDLQKNLEKQKSNTDKIINEETKGLKIERDALVKQVERLKPYDIEEKDETWSAEYLEKMERLCSEFEFAARHFIVDERLKENFPLMAQSASKIYSMNKAISELRIFWEEEFALDNEI